MRKESLLVVGGLFALGVALSLTLIALGAPRRAAGPEPPGVGLRPRTGTPLPKRIISVSPNVTEGIFALGCGDRIVAVSDFTMYPPEARAKENVGSAFSPNLERILALQPDLVIVLGKNEKVAELCRQRNFPLLQMSMDNLASIYSGVGLLGQRLGVQDRADALCDMIRWSMEGIRRRVSGRARPKVFLCLERTVGSLTGLMTTNRETFLTEMLDIAGGENIFADAVVRYPRISKEALLKRAPDVVIEIHAGEPLSEDAKRRLIADWQNMSSLPAVRNGRVYVLTEDYVLIPGPRIAYTARRLAEVLHPEAFQ